MKRQLAILGEYTPCFAPHAATNAAIAHACAASGLDVRASWISTETIDETLFDRFHGIWVAPGSPYKNFRATSFSRSARNAVFQRTDGHLASAGSLEAPARD